MNRSGVCGFLWLLAFFFLCVSKAGAQLADGIEAIVHETPVTMVEVAELSAPNIQMLSRQLAGREEEFQQQAAIVRSNNLDHLVRRQLILQEFKTFNVPETILDKDVEKRLQEIIRERYYGDRTTLIKSLQEEGITLEKFRRQIREQFIELALRQKNISSEVIISPHKVESYYQAHREEYKIEDEVNLSMIVLNKTAEGTAPDAKKLAEDILLKLGQGADFAEMAKVNSQGSQARTGGKWGWYETRKLRKEFAAEVPRLKPGQHSGVIDTPEACYIMKVDEKKSGHYKTLGEVREEIEKNLVLEERSRLETQWIAKLKKKTFVKHF